MRHGDSDTGVISDKSQKEAPRAALRDLRFVFCSHSDNYSQCKCACTVGMFAAQSGRVLAQCSIIRCLHPIRVVHKSKDRRQHSEKRVQQNLTPLKCCARPSSMEHLKCPSGVVLPHRYPEQLATPLWLPQKCKNK